MDSQPTEYLPPEAPEAPRRHAAQPVPRGVLIAVPFYRNETLVAPLVGSLLACAADIAAICGEVVLFDDSPDYAPLADALAEAVAQVGEGFTCKIETNAANLGFVRTMNRAVGEAVARRMDLILVNSDTQAEPGALREMVRVARLEHMIGFVNPRSNNATLTTLPLEGRIAGTDRAQQRRAYAALAALLPDISYVPTCVGFCMLVKWEILAEFGGFDEIYGQGYNEENDLVMRASRCGYRAVLANKAFVWHEGEASFSTASVVRDRWEATNRAILDRRYPEYGGYTAAYYHTPEAIAERLLAALIPDASGRLDIAFDFSSFRAAHNGTFQAGRQLLSAARAAWGDAYTIRVLCSNEVYAFHDYAALGFERADPHGGLVFAAIFRVGQPYDWNVMQRLIMTGAVLGIYMLDTISIDCPQLTSVRLYNIWQFALDAVDVIATQSRQTQCQLRRRFAIPQGAIEIVSLHSLELDDYRLPVPAAPAADAPAADAPAADAPAADAPAPARPAATETLLVLGNHFHHKYLSPTANALAAAFPARRVVALGQAKPAGRAEPDATQPPALGPAPNLAGQGVGDLGDADIGALYAGAAAVIFPSHAEGFGFPALNALAACKPVFVRRLPVFEELWVSQGRTPNLHFYETTAELVALLHSIPAWVEPAVAGNPPPGNGNGNGNGAERSAREIRLALDQAIGRADYRRVVRRVRAMQFTTDMSSHADGAPPPDSPGAHAARYVALKVERVARRTFRSPRLYAIGRTLFRAARAAGRPFRRT